MLVNHSIVEQLNVYTYGTREAMGAAAAEDAARRISRIIEINGAANIVFAAAPSQNDLFWALLTHDIDWTKVRAFQQDEYIGISAEEPAGFGNFLKDALYDKVTMKDIYYLYTETSKVEEKIEEYTGLLKRYPIDLIFLGVGENGHLAFNDPPVADFDAPKMLKILEDLPLLTVTDAPNFKSVGMGLALENNRMVFDLNLEQCQRVNLKPQAKLLRMARNLKKP